MNNPSYIAPNQDELFEQAPPYIKQLITGEEVNTATAILGKIYKIPVSSYVALENIITFILIGALAPENTVRAIVDLLGLSQEEAYRLAEDMEKSILEKARITILGKSGEDMVTLTFAEGRSPDELRKEILDTTKRDLGLPNVQSEIGTTAPQQSEKKVLAPAGSRTLLLEQLQVLDDIPDDSEVAERLRKIREQITGIQDQGNDRSLTSNIALQEFMPKQGDNIVVEAEAKTAPYSKAPTKYGIDPYREVVE